jgi:Coenzyme PQQ synthesis protein D (PqqD)
VKTEIDARWALSPGVRSRYSEDGAVLLDINKGVCYSLNPVVSRIWLTIEFCPSGITLEGIVGALGTHYGTPYQQLLADTKECLDSRRQLGLAYRNGRTATSPT